MNKGMLVSFTETNFEIEEELKSWFVNEHIDERAIDTDGFFRARLYECLDEGPKFFATYETINFDILASENYMEKVSNQTNWSKEIIPKLITQLHIYYMSLYEGLLENMLLKKAL